MSERGNEDSRSFDQDGQDEVLREIMGGLPADARVLSVGITPVGQRFALKVTTVIPGSKGRQTRVHLPAFDCPKRAAGIADALAVKVGAKASH